MESKSPGNHFEWSIWDHFIQEVPGGGVRIRMENKDMF